MRIRTNTFDDFYGGLKDEAKAEGPEAVADLRAKEVKYALINALVSRRRDLNLSQEQLAEESGVAQTEISRIERGRKSPTLDTFSRLVSALKIEVVSSLRTSQPQGMVAFVPMTPSGRPRRAASRTRASARSRPTAAARRRTRKRSKVSTD